MKNAMDAKPAVPGEFVASGHDYSADLARFVREAYALTCSEAQLDRIERSLRRWQDQLQAVIEAQQAGEAQAAPEGNGARPNTPAKAKPRPAS
jgi:hypothetical protein